jgi:hypothetical protein
MSSQDFDAIVGWFDGFAMRGRRVMVQFDVVTFTSPNGGVKPPLRQTAPLPPEEKVWNF